MMALGPLTYPKLAPLDRVLALPLTIPVHDPCQLPESPGPVASF